MDSLEISHEDPKIVHIPFGMHLIMHGDVSHVGICGRPGNIRFHRAFWKEHADAGSQYFCTHVESKKFNEN